MNRAGRVVIDTSVDTSRLIRTLRIVARHAAACADELEQELVDQRDEDGEA